MAWQGESAEPTPADKVNNLLTRSKPQPIMWLAPRPVCIKPTAHAGRCFPSNSQYYRHVPVTEESMNILPEY